jgi:hypothetical protein
MPQFEPLHDALDELRVPRATTRCFVYTSRCCGVAATVIIARQDAVRAIDAFSRPWSACAVFSLVYDLSVCELWP